MIPHDSQHGKGMRHLRRVRTQRELPHAVSESPSIRLVAFMVLAAYLLFAHCCHGDEDHELFGVSQIIATIGDSP